MGILLVSMESKKDRFSWLTRDFSFFPEGWRKEIDKLSLFRRSHPYLGCQRFEMFHAENFLRSVGKSHGRIISKGKSLI